jgi:hypothetical protein
MTFDNLARVSTEGSEPESLILENVLRDYTSHLGSVRKFGDPTEISWRHRNCLPRHKMPQ